MKKDSILTAISAVFVGAALTLASPAAAHEGGAGRPGPVAPDHSVAAPAPVANAAPAAADRVGTELPLAPIGTAGPGRVGTELPLAPIGTAGPDRVGSDSSSTNGQIGVGIFTDPAPVAGSQKTATEGGAGAAPAAA
jgi:hypothetical protein